MAMLHITQSSLRFALKLPASPLPAPPVPLLPSWPCTPPPRVAMHLCISSHYLRTVALHCTLYSDHPRNLRILWAIVGKQRGHVYSSKPFLNILEMEQANPPQGAHTCLSSNYREHYLASGKTLLASNNSKRLDQTWLRSGLTFYI